MGVKEAVMSKAFMVLLLTRLVIDRMGDLGPQLVLNGEANEGYMPKDGNMKAESRGYSLLFGVKF